LPCTPPWAKGLRWWNKYSSWYIFEVERMPWKVTALELQHLGPSGER